LSTQYNCLLYLSLGSFDLTENNLISYLRKLRAKIINNHLLQYQ